MKGKIIFRKVKTTGEIWILLMSKHVFNPNHASRFFMSNNDAAIKRELYKSYFPLNYGGRASSVIDVRMKEGNNKERKRMATVG